jgi:hypothetical protein
MARDIPISGLPLLVYKLRTGGVPWLLKRLRREWDLPTTGPGQAFYRAARRLRHVAGHDDRGLTLTEGMLYAFYDLAVAPITFDFLWFLVGAELARQRRGLCSVHAVIVPGRQGGLREEDPQYDQFIDAATRRARIGNILLPACALLPRVAGVTLAASRAEAAQLTAGAGGSVYPERYEPALPSYPDSTGPLRAAREESAAIGVLRAGALELRAIERWLAAQGCGGKVVTLTLRSYGYMSARNSNLPAWLAFARGLDRQRYSPVFVPDTEQCFDGIPPELGVFPVCREAAVNLGLRMALYERAYLNLGVNNGPMGLCWLNERARYITFKMLTDAAPQTTPEYMRHLGYEIGGQLPQAKPWQKFVWEDDTPAVITREFAAMNALLESAPAGL